MRILIVSDTHKSHRNLERVLEQTVDIDMLIHLGDTCLLYTSDAADDV